VIRAALLALQSAGAGASWSKPVDLTSQVKKPDWTWVATGLGVGIDTRTGQLVIPRDHVEALTKKGDSHVF
jgi:sialidase-1